jgi:hypothetical protein
MRLLFVAIGCSAMLSAAVADEPEMIRDRSYTVQAGNKSVIDAARPVGFTTLGAYIQGDKFLTAKDETGLKQLRTAGQLFDLPNRVPVLALKVVNMAPSAPPVMSASAAARFNQASQFEDYPSEAMEVRILEGEHNGQLLIVRHADVARLIAAPKLSAKAKARMKAQAKAKADRRRQSDPAP